MGRAVKAKDTEYTEINKHIVKLNKYLRISAPQGISLLYNICLEIAKYINSYGILISYINNLQNNEHYKINSKLKFEETNIEEQFSTANKRGSVDECFNLLVLSNQLKIQLDNRSKSDFEKKNFGTTMNKLKNYALNALIDFRNKGEKILIEKTKNDEKDAYYIALPGYMEPLCVYMGNGNNRVNEITDGRDNVGWKSTEIKTTFPILVTPENETILKDLIDSNEINDNDRRRIEWYFQTKKMFENPIEQENVQIPTSTILEEPKGVDIDKSHENGGMIGAMRKSASIQKRNTSYIKRLCDKYDIQLNDKQFQELIEKKNTASLEHLFKDAKLGTLNGNSISTNIEIKLRSANENVSENTIEKIYLYMILSGKNILNALLHERMFKIDKTITNSIQEYKEGKFDEYVEEIKQGKPISDIRRALNPRRRITKIASKTAVKPPEDISSKPSAEQINNEEPDNSNDEEITGENEVITGEIEIIEENERETAEAGKTEKSSENESYIQDYIDKINANIKKPMNELWKKFEEGKIDQFELMGQFLALRESVLSEQKSLIEPEKEKSLQEEMEKLNKNNKKLNMEITELEELLAKKRKQLITNNEKLETIKREGIVTDAKKGIVTGVQEELENKIRNIFGGEDGR